MDFFLRVMDITWRFVHMPFTVFGYTFSMFEVIFLVLVFSLVTYFIDAFM